MFELEKTFYFSAGHQLKHNNGLCQRPHGHTYTLTVKLQAMELKKEGPQVNMIIDFLELENLVQPLIRDYLDHRWLNDSLQCESTSLEFVTCWIYQRLKPILPALKSISLSEGTTNRVTYAE